MKKLILLSMTVGLLGGMAVSCTTMGGNNTPPPFAADANRDGVVSAGENVQYTRKLAVFQNNKVEANRVNIADVNMDGVISDAEWGQYTQRSTSIQQNRQTTGQGTQVLNNASQTLQTLNILRGVANFF